MSDADDGFAALARSTVDGMLERRPELATLLGDHAHDGRLAIGTAEYHDELARWCGDRLADLQRMDLDRLSAEYRVDARILANQLELCRFVTAELREHEWNPMLANPGRAIYLLLARDFAPLPDRLRSAGRAAGRGPGSAGRGASVAAGPLPRVHLETALSQFAGTEHLIGAELDRVLAGAPDELVPETWRPGGPRRWTRSRNIAAG